MHIIGDAVNMELFQKPLFLSCFLYSGKSRLLDLFNLSQEASDDDSCRFSSWKLIEVISLMYYNFHEITRRNFDQLYLLRLESKIFSWKTQTVTNFAWEYMGPLSI